MYEARLEGLRQALSEADVQALLVSSPNNVKYLSGFEGDSGWLLVTQSELYLITDFRFMIQAEEEAPGSTLVIYRGNVVETVKKLVDRENITRLGFESKYCSYDGFKRMETAMPGISLCGLKSMVETLREIKEPFEIDLLRKAVEIADGAFEHVLNHVRPGVSEIELAAEIEFFMRRQGADRPSFETIIGSGFRGALPHGTASRRRLESGDLVVIDFGAYNEGYCSDITRTVVIGQASPEQKKIYNIVLEAQLAALEAVAPGRRCCEIDGIAREIISANGYEANFGHGLGHGVGVEIHESPALNPRNQDELQPGMVITIEPGIYIQGWGGVRIEDMVIVTESGCEILTKSGKELLEL